MSAPKIRSSQKQSSDPVQQITESALKDVLVKGFAETYRVKPQFPIEFLGRWLKQYSKNQQTKTELISNKEPEN